MACPQPAHLSGATGSGHRNKQCRARGRGKGCGSSPASVPWRRRALAAVTVLSMLMTEAGCSQWRRGRAGQGSVAGPWCGTYSVGGAGVTAPVTFSAFRFLRVRSPPFGAKSPSVLPLVPFSLCSALLPFAGGAGGAGPAGASWCAFSTPVWPFFAFRLWGRVLGCFLEST